MSDSSDLCSLVREFNLEESENQLANVRSLFARSSIPLDPISSPVFSACNTGERMNGFRSSVRASLLWRVVTLTLTAWTVARGATVDAPPAVDSKDSVTLDVVCKPSTVVPPKLAPGNPAASTKRMAARLQAILESARPEDMAYLSDRLASATEKKVDKAITLSDRFHALFQLGIQQTQAGQPDRALNNFQSASRLVKESGAQLPKRLQVDFRMRQAIAWMRLGEQENCVFSDTGSACVFPLVPSAYHRLPRGSTEATKILMTQLEEFPNDLGTRWLLNLTMMTLGKYPAEVPPQWLIPPSTFESEFPMPAFPDVAAQVGLDLDDLAGGVIVDDFDNDGHLDIVTSAWDLKGQLRLFLNNGDGTFRERTSEAGLVGETGSLNIQQTDYNNDGWMDIWMLRGGWLGKGGRIPNSLLRNNGDGTFTDVTEEAGLLSQHPTQASRWFDYDGDGWLDLFIGNETVDQQDPDPCELYHNNHDGTFTECAAACGVRLSRFVKGVATADYDRDGRPDLFLSCRDGGNVLLHNDGPDASGQWHFSDVSAAAGPFDQPQHSFGSFFFDFDNDGWDDLLVFGYFIPRGVGDIAADYLHQPSSGEAMRFYRNLKNGHFQEVSSEVGLNRIAHTMGHNFGDLDNDGWLDFYCGTGDPNFQTLIPNRMFRNDHGRVFQDVTTATRTGHLQKGHGVAFADLNEDGAQDIYISMGGAFTGDIAKNALYLNPGNSNSWIKLKLIGTKANRAAIGSRVTLTVQTPDGTRNLYRTIGSGGSFGSNPLRLEVGLGNAVGQVSADIVWAGSGREQHVEHLDTRQAYEILEGSDVVRRVTLAPHALPPNGSRPKTLSEGKVSVQTSPLTSPVRP